MKSGFRWVAVAIMSIFVFAEAGAGELLSFDKIWRKVEATSPRKRAVQHELESAQIAWNRSGRHWFPVIHLDTRLYSTNDSGLSLFSTLSQRQMQQSDFSPDQLNHPDSSTYGKSTLSFNLPLFEGGLRVAGRSAAGKMRTAKEFQLSAITIQMYAEAAKIYGTISAEEQSRTELLSLASSLDQVISRYRIGAKENPVGYSGLLGLRNVRNRVSGSLAQNEAKAGTLREALASMAEGLPVAWRTDGISTEEFVRRYLAAQLVSDEKGSYQVESYVQMAEAAQQAKNAERAKFLPRAGLFAEGGLNWGSRNTATSYVAGAYLQWDLFAAPNFGAVKQAESNAAAAQAHADEARLHEKIESEGSRQAALALESNLRILGESAALLSEQTDVAKKLFLSGSMNALQFAEVLNRRLDLINSLIEAKTQYLAMKATLVKNSKFEISIPSGVKHE